MSCFVGRRKIQGKLAKLFCQCYQVSLQCHFLVFIAKLASKVERGQIPKRSGEGRNEASTREDCKTFFPSRLHAQPPRKKFAQHCPMRDAIICTLHYRAVLLFCDRILLTFDGGISKSTQNCAQIWKSCCPKLFCFQSSQLQLDFVKYLLLKLPFLGIFLPPM